MGSESRSREESRLEPLIYVICPYSRVISLLFAILVVFTLASLASVVALQPTHPSHATAQFTALLDGTLAVVLAGVLYRCRQFHRRT